MGMPEKVIQFENESMRNYDHIQGYFKELNRRNRDFEDVKGSSNTIAAYEGDIRLFFHLMKGKEKGKELEYLTQSDIEITQEDVEEYIAVLCDMKDSKGKNKYVNKTINRKVTSLKGLIKYLKRKKYIEIDISYLDLIKGNKERKNHYGVLESDEVLTMAELAKDDKEKGEIKRLYILTSYKTGLRLQEIADLKWNNFIVKGNEVTIKGIGKGNKEYEIPIPNSFYKELLTLNKGQEQVFDINPVNVQRMITRLSEKIGIQPERNIVFHSIRKAFGTLVWRTTGDIEIARRKLRHENVNTTQIYLGTGNYELDTSLFMIDKVDEEIYKQVTHEQLLEALNNCPKSVLLTVNLKLQELIQNN
jgi:integrase